MIARLKSRPPRAASRAAALLALGAILLSASAASAAGEGARFAIVLGNNDGGRDTRPLRFAHEDARRIHALLLRLGGVQPADARLLLGEDADALRKAFDQLEPRIRAAAFRGQSPLLLVYYSGHAKDGALRLGRSAVPLEEIKQHMARSGAQVRIGLFDSCRSGAITRIKGARRAPAFEVDAQALQAARGLVLLSSSAADEDSQESDELGGSFFSHHLASGLMGAADASGDHRVSLAEAYAYAYQRTVADTADTAAGPQHPTFAYELAGNGDVILTDLAERREGVLLAAQEPAGSWFLVDSRGAIAAEIAKPQGVELRIALAPGTYRIKRRLTDRLRIGEIRVTSGTLALLSDAGLHDVPFSDDPVKGVSRDYEPVPGFAMSLGGGYQLFFAGPFPSMPLAGLEVAFRGSFVWTLDAAFGAGSTSLQLSDGSSLPYRFSEWGLGVTLTREWPLGRLSPYAGGRLATLALGRTFEDAGVPKQSFFAMTPGLVAGLRLRLGTHWSAGLRARAHYLYYNVDYEQSLGYLEGALTLSLEL
jgi:hypothetical protein